MTMAGVHIGDVVAWIILTFVALLGVSVLLLIFRGEINLSRLISEPSGDASMSRFQLLIFTFVIALSLFLVIIGNERPAFPKDDIPPGVLMLLGISASSYLVSKGIQFSKPGGIEDHPPTITVNPPRERVQPGGMIDFHVVADRTENTRVRWEISRPDLGRIDQAGRFVAAEIAPPAGGVELTVRAINSEDPPLVGTATVTIVQRDGAPPPTRAPAADGGQPAAAAPVAVAEVRVDVAGPNGGADPNGAGR